MKKILSLLAFFYTAGAYAQLNQHWVSAVNGTGDFSDKAKDITADAGGNIYIGGYTTGTANHDYLVIKMDAAGDTVWTRTYNGTDNGEDEVNAIAVDAAGNVYVTGYANGSTGGDDYITIKYNSAGTQQWMAVYNSAYNRDDEAHDIAVDASGNVYVTGESQVSANGIDIDYATVKYNSNGALQWEKRYNGPGGQEDRAIKIGLDNGGNPVVLGRSYNGSDDDWVTFKYNAANGNQVWMNVLDYTKNDRPSDMVLDASGNVYVTGRTKDINYDMATRKIDAGGNTQWTKFFIGANDDRGTAIAVDGAGNVYATGVTDLNNNPLFETYNIITTKYNAAGTQLWSRSYVGQGSTNDDVSECIAVNGKGDVFITGQSDVDATAAVNYDYVTLKYDSTGTLVYSKTFDGGANGNDDASCLVLVAGEALVSGGAFTSSYNKDVVTIQYDAAGNISRQKNYTANGNNNDAGLAVSVDNDGNVYTAGYMLQLGEDRNMLVAKVDAGGNLLWQKSFNGTSGTSPDEATAVMADASSNSYVAGFVKDSAQSYNYCTAKLAANGDTLWVRKYNYLNGSDKANAMDMDAAGNVVVTGRSDSDTSDLSTNYDFATVKYNNNGVQQWAARYNSGGSNDDEAVSVKCTSSGSVYVAGRSTNTGNDDISLVKYNTAGNQQWARTYDGANGDDRNEDMLTDGAGNIYICGRQTAANSFFDGLLLKYDSAGTLQWAKSFNGAADGEDRFDALAFDPNGNVTVVGKTDPDNNNTNNNFDYLLVTYDAGGNILWDTTWSYSPASNDEATAISYDAQGNLLATGESDHGTGNRNYVTVKYSTGGNLNAVADYDRSGASDVPRAIATRGTAVYVTGQATGNGTMYDALTVKYDITSGIADIKANAAFSLYPNPANGVVYIKLFTRVNNDMELALTDAQGRMVKKLSLRNTLTLQVNDLAPGLYFIQLYRDETVLGTQKLVVER